MYNRSTSMYCYVLLWPIYAAVIKRVPSSGVKGTPAGPESDYNTVQYLGKAVS